MTEQTTVDESRRVDTGLDAQLSGLPWSTTEKLALTCRVLAAEQHCFCLAGQVTARVGDGTYWTAPWDPPFARITAGNLIRVDEDLGTVEGERLPNPATRFHTWIYRARPEVNCVIHTHPPFVSALSMLGRPLVVSHMDATPLYDDCAFLAEWPGLPIADREGEIISGALGGKRAILLAHHGMLTTGTTVEEAAVLALLIEHAARMQLRAESAGEIMPIPAHLAREAQEFLLQPSITQATFRSFADRVLEADPACLSPQRTA